MSNEARAGIDHEAECICKTCRRAFWMQHVKDDEVSFEDAVARARLIPKEIASEFKVVKWPDIK